MSELAGPIGAQGPHISTTCGESGASCEHPMKLWLLWDASQSHWLATCYSGTAVALRHLGPCGVPIQYSGESLMLPVNVPHAALSLSPHYLYGQAFHVEGRARYLTTLELKLSARAKPLKALAQCLRAMRKDFVIQILGFVRFTSIIVFVLYHQRRLSCAIFTQSYVSKVVEVLRDNSNFEGVCGLHERIGP